MRFKAGCLALAILASVVSDAGAASGSSPNPPLLDVPYLSQTQQLCGGAAAAMVLRYWGDSHVLPQDFASLVESSEQGIRTSVLTNAVSSRGWQAIPASLEAARSETWLAAEIGKGRPVIALLEVAPRTYHYVVVVGVTATDVVYHDPARAPFRVTPFREFDRQWAAANRWTLIVLPAAPAANGPLVASVRPVAAATPASPATASDASPCRALIAHNVTLARAGQLDDADRGLRSAQALCASTDAVALELGGVRFLQKRYGEAAELAARAVDANPRDQTAWDLLGTSRYLQGDTRGALQAWNEIDRPRTDVVSVEGVERLDHPIVVNRIDLEPRAPITPAAFARAERRLNELPTISRASLKYFPSADGSADVRAVLSERNVLPRGAIGWGAVGVNSAFRREVRLPVAGPLRQGEAFDIRYRWRPNRPRVRVTMAAPAPGAVPGILGVEAFWERQTYQPTVVPLREERRRVGAYLSDWLTDRVRWTAGGAADRFDDREFLNLHGQIDTRWLDDRVSAMLTAGYWSPAGDGRGFATGQAQVAWRSSRSGVAPEWLGRAGLTMVGASAPLAVWPIAGSGESRGPLLRAHELHTDGIVVSNVFGRKLAYASLEYQQPVYAKRGASLAVAGFTDMARSWRHPFAGTTSPFQVDVGVGLRISAPGADDQLRIDFAYGLEDRHKTLSAGYVMPFGQ